MVKGERESLEYFKLYVCVILNDFLYLENGKNETVNVCSLCICLACGQGSNRAVSSAQGIESHGVAQQVLRSTSDVPLSIAGEGPHVCTVELTQLR